MKWLHMIERNYLQLCPRRRLIAPESPVVPLEDIFGDDGAVEVAHVPQPVLPPMSSNPQATLA